MASEKDFNRHNQSTGSFAQAAANPAFELVPTEFDPGTLFLGYHMTGTLSRREDGKFTFTPDIVKIPDVARSPGDTVVASKVNHWGGGWGKFGLDPKAEQEAMQKEQEQYAYEMGKAKCLKNPMAYGVGIILSDGTWLSHERAMELAHSKPSVNHRNIAGPGEIPFLMTEHGAITEAETLRPGDKAAVARYAECDEQAKLSAKHTGEITSHTYNPDGSESVSMEFVGARWDVTVKDAKGDEQTYQFADPKFIGKDVTLEGETTYVVAKPNSTIEIPDEESAAIDPHKLLDEGLKQLLENTGIPPEPAAISIPFAKLPKALFIDPNVPLVERARMREDVFAKRILPPVAITNDELDRSILTKPQPKDYPCNAEGYIRHCRLYNQMVAGTPEPPIPESEIQAIEEASMKLKLMTHADPDYWKKLCLGLKERADANDAYWAQFTNPALGLPHVERVAQDEDCGAIVVTPKESTDASGPNPA